MYDYYSNVCAKLQNYRNCRNRFPWHQITKLMTTLLKLRQNITLETKYQITCLVSNIMYWTIGLNTFDVTSVSMAARSAQI